MLERGLLPGVLEASADGDAGADFLLTVAEAHRLLGQRRNAQRYLDDCVARCEQHGLTAIRVRARREQAELHAATGKYRAAYEEHRRYSDELSELQSAQRDARARAMQAMYEAAEARQLPRTGVRARQMAAGRSAWTARRPSTAKIPLRHRRATGSA